MTENRQRTQVWGKRLDATPDELNIKFCSGRDVSALPMADEELFKYDIWTNLAHAKMLFKIGVLDEEEKSALVSALLELHGEYLGGKFHLDSEKEDVHINIEHHLTYDQNIEAGKKIHTGRSRNDQIATDMRLYLREQLIELSKKVIDLIDCILSQAKNELKTIMPGFTHYQPAMLTTVAHWFTSWSQALLRDVESLLQNLQTVNKSPLGAAASFGTSWPIDREYCAELMGFDGVEDNSLDCISTRGENETRIAASVALLMNHLSTISQDIIVLSTPYYGMFKVDDRFVTGSSIMPQKRNPDFAELIRGKASVSHGILMSLLGIQKGAISGYNRDTQLSKYLILDLMRECLEAPQLLAMVIEELEFDRQVMADRSLEGFMNGADVADWLAREYHLPFRECYDVLSLAVKKSESVGRLTREAIQESIDEIGMNIQISKEISHVLDSPLVLLEKKRHTGAPSPDSVTKSIKSQSTRGEELKDQFRLIEERLNSARKGCFTV